jgi:hypothetical protein
LCRALQNVGGEWWAYEDESGSTYYLNASTQETQWETPTPDQIGTAEGAAAPPAAPHDDGLPHGWEALIDEAGDHYYYHEATGSSQWDKPTDDAARAAAAYAAGDYTVAVSVEEYERAKNLLGWQVRSISYDRTVAISQLAELIERHVADVDVIFGFLFDEAISDAPALTMVMLTGFLTERAQGLSVSKELFLQLSLHSRLDKTGSGTVNKEEFIEGMKEVVVLPEGSPFRAWFLRELDCDYVPAAGEEPSLDSGAPAPADTWDVTYWKALASQLHDIWRSSRARLTDGSYEPRPKLVDGEWYDIANLTYAELPEHFKKSNQESAQCACNEVMNAVAAGRSLDAVFVEDASVVQHVNWMRVNGEWADPGLMVDYGELPEDEKEKDRVIVRKAVESWITLKSRYAEVVAWQEEVTAGSKSAYSSRRSTALPLSFAVNLDHEEKQAPALSAEEQNAAHAKAVKMSGAEAAKREQQAIFKSQWAHSLSGWAYKKQQRRSVLSFAVSRVRDRVACFVASLVRALTRSFSLADSLTHTHTLSLSLHRFFTVRAATSSRNAGSCSKMARCTIMERKWSTTKENLRPPPSLSLRSKMCATHRQRFPSARRRARRGCPSTSTSSSALLRCAPSRPTSTCRRTHSQ